jgi:hypothetical protein
MNNTKICTIEQKITTQNLGFLIPKEQFFKQTPELAKPTSARPFA